MKVQCFQAIGFKRQPAARPFNEAGAEDDDEAPTFVAEADEVNKLVDAIEVKAVQSDISLTPALKALGPWFKLLESTVLSSR